MKRDLVHEWGLAAAETFVLLLLLIRAPVAAWVWLPILALISLYALLVRYDASPRWRTLTALMVGMTVVVYVGVAMPLVAYGSYWLMRRLHLYDTLAKDLQWCRHQQGLFGAGLFILSWEYMVHDTNSGGLFTLSVLLGIIVGDLLIRDPKEIKGDCDVTTSR